MSATDETQYNETRETVEDLPKVIKETKAGYKTTEFWAVIAAALTVAFTDVPLPDDTKGLVLAALAGVYAAARALSKKGVPSVEDEKK